MMWFGKQEPRRRWLRVLHFARLGEAAAPFFSAHSTLLPLHDMLANSSAQLLRMSCARHARRSLALAGSVRHTSSSSSEGAPASSSLYDQLSRPLPDEASPPLRIQAYPRSVRAHRKVSFLALTDGSLPGLQTLQAVLPSDVREAMGEEVVPGQALQLDGRLVKSRGAGQDMEFKVEIGKSVGSCDAGTYPFSLTTTSTPTDLLRRNAHLRSRDARHAAVVRARDSLERGLAGYFYQEDFTKVATPIITSSDCEGAGEVFRVVSDAEASAPASLPVGTSAEPTASGDAAPAATGSASFWSTTQAYLTVSSQLHLEALAHAISRVWTLSPSFRAEGSATNRHLAEFWMCEAELVAADLESVMRNAEGAVKAAVRGALGQDEGKRAKRAEEDAKFLLGSGSIAAVDAAERLQELAGFTETTPWPRLSYTEAIAKLQAQHSSSPFAIAPTWGEGLASEHERWLASASPIFITNYPASGKPFYMRLNEPSAEVPGETVACFDLLIPRVGELIGGSLREERADVLSGRVEQLGLDVESLSWYVADLRKYGCAPHGGWGMGFERLLSWVTGTENLRDCVTFPRTKGPVRY